MSKEKTTASRCSFCQAELGESRGLTIPGSGAGGGQRVPMGVFCSPHCRDCVLALSALNPSPLAPVEFIATRTVLTDGLLELWRRREGPDPLVVLAAAERAGRGLASPVPLIPAAPTGGARGKAPVVPPVRRSMAPVLVSSVNPLVRFPRARNARD